MVRRSKKRAERRNEKKKRLLQTIKDEERVSGSSEGQMFSQRGREEIVVTGRASESDQKKNRRGGHLGALSAADRRYGLCSSTDISSKEKKKEGMSQGGRVSKKRGIERKESALDLPLCPKKGAISAPTPSTSGVYMSNKKKGTDKRGEVENKAGGGPPMEIVLQN